MKFYSKFSLRLKLLMLGAITLLVVGSGAWISLEKVSSQYSQASMVSLNKLAKIAGDKVAAQFFERYGDVQAFAENESIQSLDSARMQGILNSYISIYGIYDLILVVNAKGQFVSANSKDPAGKEVNKQALKGKDFANEAWFKAVMQGKTTNDKTNNFSGTYFEDVMLDPMVQLAFGEERVGNSFSAAIKDGYGDIIGVVTNRAGERWLQYDLKAVLADAKDAGFKNGEIYIINQKGLVLQNEESFDGENDKVRETLRSNLIADGNDLAKRAAAGESGFGETHNKNEKRTDAGGFAPIVSSKWIKDIGWSVVFMDPKDEVLADVNDARTEFMILMAVACFLSLTFSTWFAIVLTKSLNRITDSLHVNSSEVTEASVKIASQATELSESATEQAAALQETMSAVDEISAMVEKNAEAAGRSKEVSANSKEAAERGRSIVDQMLSAIGQIDATNTEISQQMENSNQELSEITKLITDIGSKTKVINEIVFQTKLLSFNASVEAARAGEYGKGFSVVAEEVGNLAQMSGNAAKEITSLLEESVRKVDQIVGQSKSRVEKMVRVSREKVDLGSKTAKDCNLALEEILSNVENVDSLVSEIAVASQEQSTGIKEISKAVSQMEQVTQMNSSVAQSSSVSAEHLRTQATSLNEVVQTLVTQVSGAGVTFNQSHQAEIIPITKNKAKEIQSKVKHSASAHSQSVGQKAVGSEFTPSANDPGFDE